MTQFFKWTFWTFVVLFVLSMVLGTVLVGSALDGLHDAGHWHVVVDGETLADEIVIDEHLSAGGGVLAALATGAVLLLVLPVVLIVGIGLPLLLVAMAMAGVVFALLGVSALVAAPVLVPVLLIVWLARRSRPKVAP